MKALDHGGTVYFDVPQYSGFTHSFAPVILAVSTTKIEIRSAMGGPGDQIVPALVKMSFDKPADGFASLKRILDPAGPFLKVEVARQKSKGYKFAAVGTTCPDASTAKDKDLEDYPGGACGAQGTSVQTAKSVDILVPHEWFQNLKTIQDTVEHAKQGPSASLKP